MGKKKQEEEITLDLDQAMADGMEVFQGELEEAALEKPSITPKPQSESSPSQETPAPGQAGGEDQEPLPDGEEGTPSKEAGTDTTGEDTAGEPETGETPEEGEPPKETETPSEPKPDLRFKTHEEAEKGYRHLQSEKTKAEKRARDLEKELAARKDAEARRAKDEESDQKFAEYSEQRHQEALKAIETLDPDEDGYHEKVARIWAEKDRDVRRYDRELSQQSIDTTPSDSQEGNQPAETGTPEAGEAPSREAIVAYVNGEAEKAGVDPADEHFQLECRIAPVQDEQGRELTLAEQVEWAISKTKAYHQSVEDRIRKAQEAEARQKAETAQERDLPMGRSGAHKPAETPDLTPVSLNDAIDDAMNDRRL